jgi:hypothetical protein
VTTDELEQEFDFGFDLLMELLNAPPTPPLMRRLMDNILAGKRKLRLVREVED